MLSVALTCGRPHFEIRAAFDVQPGEILGLFGHSGAGKSTLLEAIAGLHRPVAGVVTLDERALTRLDEHTRLLVPPWERRVGLVRQDAGGFPHLTVAGNLAYGLPGGRLDAPTIALATALGLGALLERPARRLSGGERRRLALAQTLAARPQALLLDEPYAALDAPVRLALGDQVRDLVRERNLPAVLVSHDLAETQRWCDRVVVLLNGQVRQVADAAALVARPADVDVARLVGYTALLPGDLVGAPGHMVAIHPERVVLGATSGRGPVATGRVVRRTPRGPGWLVTLSVAPDIMLDVALAGPPPELGTRCAVTLLDPPTFPAEALGTGTP